MRQELYASSPVARSIRDRAEAYCESQSNVSILDTVRNNLQEIRSTLAASVVVCCGRTISSCDITRQRQLPQQTQQKHPSCIAAPSFRL